MSKPNDISDLKEGVTYYGGTRGSKRRIDKLSASRTYVIFTNIKIGGMEGTQHDIEARTFLQWVKGVYPEVSEG